MSKDDIIEFRGEVTDVLPNGMFRVKLENDHVIIGHLSGRLRKNKIKILLGDAVNVEMSPYDTDRGRISWRFK